MNKLENKLSVKAFTLVELLIVMAVLGVISVVVLAAIDPGEKTAQARDSGRISTVAQLGHAVEAYYTLQGAYPSATWAQELVSAGELSTFPTGVAYSVGSASPCTSFPQPGIDETYCYAFNAVNGALVFATAEAKVHNGKCTLPNVAYFTFSTADGRGGTICANGDPSPWVAGAQAYVD